jgi:hypothetical protein
MLKKILSLLLCINLHATEEPLDYKFFGITIISGAIGFGAAALTAYSSNSALVGASSKLNAEDISKMLTLGRTVITLAAGMVGVFTTASVYPVIKDAYEYNYPTKSQRAFQEANASLVRKKLALLEAEEELRTCLLNCKHDSEISISGIPSICEQAAHMLEMLGGKNEVNRMSEAFKKHRK